MLTQQHTLVTEKMSEFKLKRTHNLLYDSTWPRLQAVPFKGHMQSHMFWNSQVKLGIFSAAEIKSMAYSISLHKTAHFYGN